MPTGDRFAAARLPLPSDMWPTAVEDVLSGFGNIDDVERAERTALMMSVYSTVSRLARKILESANEEAAEELTGQYFRFMILLTRESPKPINGQLSTMSPPSRIDQLWCLHIAESYSYTQMCANLSPKSTYIHHSTLRSVPTGRQERLQRAAQAYRHQFRSSPPAALWEVGESTPDRRYSLQAYNPAVDRSMQMPPAIPPGWRVGGGVPVPGSEDAAGGQSGNKRNLSEGVQAMTGYAKYGSGEQRGEKRSAAATVAGYQSLAQQPAANLAVQRSGLAAFTPSAAAAALPLVKREVGQTGSDAAGKVPIFVETGFGSVLQFQVRLSVTMERLRVVIEKDIEKRTGAVVDGKILTQDAQRVNLDWTLRQHGLKGGETLQWVPSQQGC